MLRDTHLCRAICELSWPKLSWQVLGLWPTGTCQTVLWLVAKSRTGMLSLQGAASTAGKPCTWPAWTSTTMCCTVQSRGTGKFSPATRTVYGHCGTSIKFVFSIIGSIFAGMATVARTSTSKVWISTSFTVLKVWGLLFITSCLNHLMGDCMITWVYNA